jgi:hypothetical protein
VLRFGVAVERSWALGVGRELTARARPRPNSKAKAVTQARDPPEQQQSQSSHAGARPSRARATAKPGQSRRRATFRVLQFRGGRRACGAARPSGRVVRLSNPLGWSEEQRATAKAGQSRRRATLQSKSNSKARAVTQARDPPGLAVSRRARVSAGSAATQTHARLQARTAASCAFPTPDSRLPTPDSRLPTPDSRLPTPDSCARSWSRPPTRPTPASNRRPRVILRTRFFPFRGSPC